MKYLFDIHLWIWWYTRSHKHLEKVQSIIADAIHFEELLISAISIWKFCKLIENERLGIFADPFE